MIKAGWSRTYVNMQIGNVKRCFKWAASRELIPPSVFHGLQAVTGLRQGKCDARETDPVRPVPEEWVEETIRRGCPSRQVEGLIRLQLACGMRPGEAVIMRGCDVDTTSAVWPYTPQRHKTQHHGHARAVFLGPQAQAVVRQFFKPDTQAFLFSPADAERERRDELHAARKTQESCGNAMGTNQRRKPGKEPGERYTVASYYRAIVRACDEAFPPQAENGDGARRTTGAITDAAALAARAGNAARGGRGRRAGAAVSVPGHAVAGAWWSARWPASATSAASGCATSVAGSTSKPSTTWPPVAWSSRD
jgi:integrase